MERKDLIQRLENIIPNAEKLADEKATNGGKYTFMLGAIEAMIESLIEDLKGEV